MGWQLDGGCGGKVDFWPGKGNQSQGSGGFVLQTPSLLRDWLQAGFLCSENREEGKSKSCKTLAVKTWE